jgi:hypothetical protein
VASCEERQNSDVSAGRIEMTETRQGGVKEPQPMTAPAIGQPTPPASPQDSFSAVSEPLQGKERHQRCSLSQRGREHDQADRDARDHALRLGASG